MFRAQWSLDKYHEHVGQFIGHSEWLLIDQDRINQFADATEDRQFIHVDVERAKASPFGGTIAHGFLSLSLLSAMAYSAIPVLENAQLGLNYGFNSVRFLSPVPSGKRIRGVFTLKELTPRGPNRWLKTFTVEVEIEGEPKPALVCEWTMLSVL